MRSRKFLFAIVVVFVTILSGCWNYRELDDVAIVSGFALDKYQDDRYYLTLEIVEPNQKGGETELSPEIYGIEGDSVFGAVRNAVFRVGKRLYWSHTKIAIINKEIASESMLPVLDWVSRDAEVRSDMIVLISDGETAREIMDVKLQGQDIFSFHIFNTVQNENISKFIKVPLWKFIDSIMEDNTGSVLPRIRKVKYKERYIGQVYGMSVFKKDRLIGYLDGNETRSLKLITGRPVRVLVVIKEKGGGRPTRVSLEVFNNYVDIEPKWDGNQLTMKVNIKIESGIGEISTDRNLIDEKGRKRLSRRAEKMLRREIEELIRKSQNKYEVDIFGFAPLIERKMPIKWKEMEGDWERIYREMEPEVSVTLTIKGSALKSKPIKVGE